MVSRRGSLTKTKLKVWKTYICTIRLLSFLETCRGAGCPPIPSPSAFSNYFLIWNRQESFNQGGTKNTREFLIHPTTRLYIHHYTFISLSLQGFVVKLGGRRHKSLSNLKQEKVCFFLRFLTVFRIRIMLMQIRIRFRDDDDPDPT